MMLEVNEQRKRGQPKMTWRRQVEESVKKVGLKIEEAGNRTRRRKVWERSRRWWGAFGHLRWRKKRIETGWTNGRIMPFPKTWNFLCNFEIITLLFQNQKFLLLPVGAIIKDIALVSGGCRSVFRPVRSDTASPKTRHRCQVSSKLGCPGSKPQRCAPQFVPCYGANNKDFFLNAVILLSILSFKTT